MLFLISAIAELLDNAIDEVETNHLFAIFLILLVKLLKLHANKCIILRFDHYNYIGQNVPWYVSPLSSISHSIVQAQNGATFVYIDKVTNPRDGNPALLIQGNFILLSRLFIEFALLFQSNPWSYSKVCYDLLINFYGEDDGGGMDPESLRRCMSFGFSDKHSSSIGQCMQHLKFVFHTIVLFFPDLD